MVTITENYVSFEIAKLLKEKGFDWDCNAGYFITDYNVYKKGCLVAIDKIVKTELYSDDFIIPTPTLAVVQKWLLEMHNYFIEITCDVNDHKWFYTNVYKLGDETWEQNSYWNLTFDTYENALEAGIKYCMGKLTGEHEIAEKNDEQSEYSYFETTYICGSKPHWNVGDILAFYEFYSDREGEVLLGEVTDVKFDEEFGDWDYTFKDGYQTFEETLLSEKAYKKL